MADDEVFVPDRATDQLFTKQTLRYKHADGTEIALPYRLYVPDGAAERKVDQQWPLLVWLHGYGEAGGDNRAHIRWLEYVVQEGGRGFPGFVLAYQCPYERRTWSDGTVDEQPITITKAIIDELLETEPIDRQRIYLSGVSSGGNGVWEMLLRYPDLFAAAAPLASGGAPSSNLAAIKHIPIWAFHAREDPQSSVQGVRAVVKKIQAIGGKANLTETPGYTHDCWTAAFTDFHFLDWLLSQQKGVDGPVPTTSRLQPQLALWIQALIAHGPQYYVAVPTFLVVAWWLVRRQLKKPRHLASTRNDPQVGSQTISGVESSTSIVRRKN